MWPGCVATAWMCVFASRLYPGRKRGGETGGRELAERCVPLRSMAIAFYPVKLGRGCGGSSCCRWCYLPENRCQGCGKESGGIRKEAEGDAGAGRV